MASKQQIEEEAKDLLSQLRSKVQLRTKPDVELRLRKACAHDSRSARSRSV